MKPVVDSERTDLKSGWTAGPKGSTAEDDWISLGLALSMVQSELLIAYGRRRRPLGDEHPSVDQAFKPPNRPQLMTALAQVNRLRRDTVTFSGETAERAPSDKPATFLEVVVVRSHFSLIGCLREGHVQARSRCLQSRYGETGDVHPTLLGPGAWTDGVHKPGVPGGVIPDYETSSLIPLIDVEVGAQIWHTAIEVDQVALRNHLTAQAAAAAIAEEHAEIADESYLEPSAKGWDLSWAGIRAVIPDSVGIAMIAVLLSEPGSDLSWSELLQAAYSRRGDKTRTPDSKAWAKGTVAPIHRATGQNFQGQVVSPTEEALKRKAESARQSCYHGINHALLVIATVCPPFVKHMGLLQKGRRGALVSGKGKVRYSPRPTSASPHLRRDEHQPITTWVLRWRGEEFRIPTENASEDVGMTAIEVLCLQQGVAFGYGSLEAIVEFVRKQIRSGFSTYEEAVQSFESPGEQWAAAEQGYAAQHLVDSIRMALGAVKRGHGRRGEKAAAFLDRAISINQWGILLKPKLGTMTASPPSAQQKAALGAKV